MTDGLATLTASPAIRRPIPPLAILGLEVVLVATSPVVVRVDPVDAFCPSPTRVANTVPDTVAHAHTPVLDMVADPDTLGLVGVVVASSPARPTETGPKVALPVAALVAAVTEAFHMALVNAARRPSLAGTLGVLGLWPLRAPEARMRRPRPRVMRLVGPSRPTCRVVRAAPRPSTILVRAGPLGALGRPCPTGGPLAVRLGLAMVVDLPSTRPRTSATRRPTANRRPRIRVLVQGIPCRDLCKNIYCIFPFYNLTEPRRRV